MSPDEKKRREEPKGSPDAGIAPEWPRRTYNDEASKIHDERTAQQDDGGLTGKKAED